MHIDLRMVDTSDFIIAYCPTNIYSVGTVHEIVLASQQHKPVLFVSPRLDFPTFAELRPYVRHDKQGSQILDRLEKAVLVKPNPEGFPSVWYMALLGGHNFFDGFGFARYAKSHRWHSGPIDKREKELPPKRPLLPFLDRLNVEKKKPTRYNPVLKKEVPDEDWLLLELGQQ